MVLFYSMGLYTGESLPFGDFRGVELLPIGPGLNSEELGEVLGGLVIPAHVDMRGDPVEQKPAELLGDTRFTTRGSDSPRYYPYARDHFPHADLAYWGDENPFATVLYPARLVGRVASTGFFDTSLLLNAAEKDCPGITEILRGGTTVFSGANYYKVLPKLFSEAAIQRTLKEKDRKSLEQLTAEEAGRFPPKRFPTILKHPFRRGDCIMIDVVHTVAIEGTQLPEDEIQRVITQFVDKYLALRPEELAERSYYKLHTWKEGEALVWPQIGTLHQAGASPDGEITRDMLRQLII